MASLQMEDMAAKEYTRKWFPPIDNADRPKVVFGVLEHCPFSCTDAQQRLPSVPDRTLLLISICTSAIERRQIAFRISATVMDSVDNQYLCPVVA